jgi:putative transposase
MPYFTRKSNRLKGYNYAQNNKYFITVCVKNKRCYFGKVNDNKMLLNDYGRIVEKQWNWLKEQYPYVILHGYVVMPNHFHGILEIKIPPNFNQEADIESHNKIKSISSLVGAFKTTSSKQLHNLGLNNFQWHRSFYDRIIYNETSYYHISHYIKKNPSRWKYDSMWI